MLLTIIAEMLTDEDVEIQVGIEELAAMLPQRELFLERNRGPTDFNVSRSSGSILGGF